MEDLQEEIRKLVNDGGQIDEDQANMVKPWNFQSWNLQLNHYYTQRR